MRTPLLLFLTVAIAPSTVSGQDLKAEPTSSIWTFETADDIRQLRHGAFGQPILLVGTKKQFIALDRETGSPLWTRDQPGPLVATHRLELENAVNGDTLDRFVGFIRDDDHLLAVSLTSGATLWTTEDLPFRKPDGYLPVAQTLLFFGETDASKSTVVAVSAATGAVEWRQDNLFRDRPKRFKEPGGPMGMLGHQSPVQDSDTTALIFVSRDGPMKLDLRTGALIWRTDELAQEDAPVLRDGYESMFVYNGLFYVPFDDQRLAAIDRTTGRVRWIVEFKNRVRMMRMRPAGLIVYGANDVGGQQYLNAVDPRTGAFLWPEAFVHVRSLFTEHQGHLYLMARDHVLIAIDVSTGQIRELDTLAFEKGDPDFIEWRGDRMLLVADHELTLLEPNAGVVYQRSFSKPGGGLLGVMNSLMDQEGPEQATGLAEDYIYIFTNEPDSTGLEGNSYVRVRKDTGEITGRLWFEKKDPEYTLTPGADIVVVRGGKKELFALRFER